LNVRVVIAISYLSGHLFRLKPQGEPMATFIAVYGSIAVIAAIVAAIVAAVKRRDYSYWATVTLLFPPMLAVLLIMPRNKGLRRGRESLEDQEERQLAGDERY
jgi:hypothetical protein